MWRLARPGRRWATQRVRRTQRTFRSQVYAGHFISGQQSTQHRRSSLTGTADESAPLRNQRVKIEWNLLLLDFNGILIMKITYRNYIYSLLILLSLYGCSKDPRPYAASCEQAYHSQKGMPHNNQSLEYLENKKTACELCMISNGFKYDAHQLTAQAVKAWLDTVNFSKKLPQNHPDLRYAEAEVRSAYYCNGSSWKYSGFFSF